MSIIRNLYEHESIARESVTDSATRPSSHPSSHPSTPIFGVQPLTEGSGSLQYLEGYLELILGPMFSGKTTQLVQIYKKYTYIRKRVSVINYFADTRYDDSMLSTHDKLMIPCILGETISKLWYDESNYYYKQLHESEVILINEGQFFGDLFECVLDMVEKHKKTVYICGLDGDFKRQRFGRLLDLIPYCDKINKLQSLCSNCKNGKGAIFSHRLSQEASQIVIGSDNYVPLCRKCYIEFTTDSDICARLWSEPVEELEEEA